MKQVRMPLLIMMALLLAVSIGFALEGSAERGKELFTDPSFAGGKKACNNSRCHPDGMGLESAGGKKSFVIFKHKTNSLEEAINYCIVNANKGKAIPEDSQDMKDLMAYIKSLGEKTAPGYDSPGYGK